MTYKIIIGLIICAIGGMLLYYFVDKTKKNNKQ